MIAFIYETVLEASVQLEAVAGSAALKVQAQDLVANIRALEIPVIAVVEC